jgi:hypothetical protein
MLAIGPVHLPRPLLSLSLLNCAQLFPSLIRR